MLRRVGHGGHGQIHLTWLSEIFCSRSSNFLGCLCRISKTFGLSFGFRNFRLRFGFGCLSQRWKQYGCLADQRALPNSMKLQLLYRWTYQQFKPSRPCISQHRFGSNLKENNDLAPFTNMNHELLGALLGEPIDFAISDDLDLEPGESTCPGSAWTPFGLLAMLQGEKAP